MTMIKLEINALNADDLLRQIHGLQMGAAGVTAGNTVVNLPVSVQDTKEDHQRDASSYEAECEELQAKLSDEQAKVATLEKAATKLNTQLKDAEAGAEKSHKAFLEEKKRADAAEAKLKETLAQLGGATPTTAAPVDTATNDADADAALDAPEVVKADDAVVKAAPRTQRTTRNVNKPAEETAEHKALRETITNDLLDLGGLAETNKQVATDVEEVLKKYEVTNGADLKTEQLADASADIGELIGVYFK